MTRWRERSRVVIVNVMAQNPGLSRSDLRKKISEAYPFGARAYHPYKVWREEVNKLAPRDAKKPTPDEVKYFWVKV